MPTTSNPLGINHNMGVMELEFSLKSLQSAQKKIVGQVAHHTEIPENHIIMCDIYANIDRTQSLRPPASAHMHDNIFSRSAGHIR